MDGALWAEGAGEASELLPSVDEEADDLLLVVLLLMDGDGKFLLNSTPL